MRLNGWQRLWIVCSAIYFIVVACVTYLSFPGREVPHSDEFYRQLASASVAKLAVDAEHSWLANPNDVGASVRLPNGHVLPFRKGVTEEEQIAVANEYYHYVNEEVAARRRRELGYAIVVWVVPCLAVLLLGYAIAWVRRGFRSNRQAP
jgi:hypothetical protein